MHVGPSGIPPPPPRRYGQVDVARAESQSDGASAGLPGGKPDLLASPGFGTQSKLVWGCTVRGAMPCGSMRLPRSRHLAGTKQQMRAEVEAAAPAHFVCPIAMHIMRDPVVLSTGQT